MYIPITKSQKMGVKMGCPDVSYKIMCQRFDKMIYSRNDIDLSADMKELENRIKSKEHTPEYYFNAGVIARGYLDEIHENGDAVNAYIGGLNQFCWTIGLDGEDDEDENN